MKTVFLILFSLVSTNVMAKKLQVPTTVYCDTYMGAKAYKLTTTKTVILDQATVGFKVYGFLDQYGIPTVQITNLFTNTDSLKKSSAKTWVLPGGVTNIFLTLDDENDNEQTPVGSVTCATTMKEMTDREKLINSL